MASLLSNMRFRSNLPTYPNILSAPPGPGTPPDIYVTDPNFATPTTQQFSFQVETKIDNASSITIGYLRCARQPSDADAGHQSVSLGRYGWLYLSDVGCLHGGSGDTNHLPASPGRNGSGPTEFGFRPHQPVRQRRQTRCTMADSSSSIADSPKISCSRARTRVPKSSIPLRTATSVVPGNGGDDAKVAQDTLLPNLDRGPGNTDINHRFVFSGVWDINYANGIANPIARGFLSYWQFSPISQVQSDGDLRIQASGDPNNDGNQFNDRSPG